MAQAPSPPWILRCPYCEYHIVVNARGARGKDPGSGVESANLLKEHAAQYHDKTWPEVTAALDRLDST